VAINDPDPLLASGAHLLKFDGWGDKSEMKYERPKGFNLWGFIQIQGINVLWNVLMPVQ
jgi:hypothetical protein